MIPGLLNTIGLLLDIVGVCLIYRYGLSKSLNRGYLTWRGLTEEELSQQTRFHNRRSRVGLACILTGFVLQILGGWIP